MAQESEDPLATIELLVKQGLDQDAAAMCDSILGRPSPSEDPEVLALRLNDIAGRFAESGRFEVSAALYERSFNLRAGVLGSGHHLTLQALNNYAAMLSITGRHAEAVPLLRSLLDLRLSSLGRDHRDTGQALANLAAACHGLGKYEEAESFYRRALEIWIQILGSHHSAVAATWSGLGDLLIDCARFEEARDCYECSYDALRRGGAATRTELSIAVAKLAEAHEAGAGTAAPDLTRKIGEALD